MKNDFRIGSRSVGTSHRPFLIAEMSGNHNQSLDRALAIVDAAARAGADALKIQTYTAETMTLDLTENEFSISDAASLWNGRSLYSLYQEAYTPWEWHEPIFARCRELGLIPFSTPFDESAVEFLESLSVPAYKVASFENTDIPLIKRIAQTGKPMIISTGMATIAELDETVRAARNAGCNQLVLLKCTSTYPASPNNTNLRTIPHMADLFDLPIGLSDHTMGIGVAVAAIAFGAVIIEKHFTLCRADGGVDSAFSLEPEEFTALRSESEKAWLAVGEITYGATESEKRSLQFRRSLYVTCDIPAGEVFTRHNVKELRPGLGLPPKYTDMVLGRRARVAIKKGTPVSWELLGS